MKKLLLDSVGRVSSRKGRYKMKVYITEYDDGRKCISVGESEEDATILTENVVPGHFYIIKPEQLPEAKDYSVLDPGIEYMLMGGELYTWCDGDVPLKNVCELVHCAVDLWHEDGVQTFHAKGVLVKCLLDTGVYELSETGEVTEIEE